MADGALWGIGINLCEKNLSVSLCQNGNFKLLRRIPSILICPGGTIVDPMKLIGRNYDSIKKYAEEAGIELFRQREGHRVEIGFKNEDNKEVFFLPEGLLGMLLRELKAAAVESLPSQVQEAVFCIPAHFNSFRRQAVVDAAGIAGMRITAFLSDHSAIALTSYIRYKETLPRGGINVLAMHNCKYLTLSVITLVRSRKKNEFVVQSLCALDEGSLLNLKNSREGYAPVINRVLDDSAKYISEIYTTLFLGARRVGDSVSENHPDTLLLGNDTLDFGAAWRAASLRRGSGMETLNIFDVLPSGIGVTEKGGTRIEVFSGNQRIPCKQTLEFIPELNHGLLMVNEEAFKIPSDVVTSRVHVCFEVDKNGILFLNLMGPRGEASMLSGKLCRRQIEELSKAHLEMAATYFDTQVPKQLKLDPPWVNSHVGNDEPSEEHKVNTEGAEC
ncbi:OLC1v1022241C1 [Oldenlandia corymbosa var. corymbosa]|uniref:OLC1v1022241C1 n=1 Tax=Oldenlandia corymbosa var. corymbosa TaxID=529605 RepID=A0AAV1C009_OLDCO|nr:OLC1v1022241C1 [Oldenlandia corymbosa var. corymbosa]